MKINQKRSNLIFSVIIVLTLMPFFTPAMGLVTGIILAIAGFRNKSFTRHTSFILQASIVMMGLGMNLTQVMQASQKGFLFTTISVVFTVSFGIILAKWVKGDKKTGLLIATGTAICGGSAIAAVAPVINAKEHQTSISLIVVFFLNAVALIIFPIIGHHFQLSQEAFGYWSAIAIHDTSSVVGAASSYGSKALEIATTVKLARALWIIPMSILMAVLYNEKGKGKIKIPWFIGLFILSILAAHFIPQWGGTFSHLSWLGKKGMVAALFLIGVNMDVAEVKRAGVKNFALGVTLWIIIAVSSLSIIMLNR